MMLYHGSYVEIPKPDLFHSRSNVDFGKEFYTTPILLQKKYARVVRCFAKEAELSLGEALDFFIIRLFMSLLVMGYQICIV